MRKKEFTLTWLAEKSKNNLFGSYFEKKYRVFAQNREIRKNLAPLKLDFFGYRIVFK